MILTYVVKPSSCFVCCRGLYPRESGTLCVFSPPKSTTNKRSWWRPRKEYFLLRLLRKGLTVFPEFTLTDGPDVRRRSTKTSTKLTVKEIWMTLQIVFVVTYRGRGCGGCSCGRLWRSTERIGEEYWQWVSKRDHLFTVGPPPYFFVQSNLTDGSPSERFLFLIWVSKFDLTLKISNGWPVFQYSLRVVGEVDLLHPRWSLGVVNICCEKKGTCTTYGNPDMKNISWVRNWRVGRLLCNWMLNRYQYSLEVYKFLRGGHLLYRETWCL